MADYVVGIVEDFKKTLLDSGSINLSLEYSAIKPITLPRKQWTPSLLQNSLVWIGGGGAYLINNQYLILVQRSMEAPSNPGKLTISTGLSDSAIEWENPSMLKRELYEEIIMLDHQCLNYFYPSIDEDSRIVIQNSLKGTPYETYTGLPLASQWLEDIEVDSITVHTYDKKIISKGLIHLNVNHINLLFCCQINQSIPLGKIKFFDSEFTMVNEEKKFLNRIIFFYDLNNNQVLNEDFSIANQYELTSHAEYLINNIKNKRR